MHICKSVLKYYNFIFYSISPLAPSLKNRFSFSFSLLSAHLTHCSYTLSYYYNKRTVVFFFFFFS